MNFKIRDVLTISNLLSLFRLLLSIPVFYFLNYINLSFNYRLIVVGIILVALATDFLDGYFARKRNEITEFGKIIDPLADKVLVAVTVLQMYFINEIPAYFFYIIILRDILIFFSGIYITTKIKRVLPSNLLGKITVVVIGLFILAVLLDCEYYFKFGYYSLMYLSIGLSFASVIGYGIRAKETLIWYKNESVQEH
jgi:cardiolipin synthase (CMP-forming)